MRREIFSAIKAGRGEKPFSAAEVEAIDDFLDHLAVPRDGAASTSDALDKAVALIKKFEGCRLTAYPDPGSGGDPWTIGWGSTGPGIAKGVTWTQAQADARCAQDVAKFMAAVDREIGAAPTTPGQRSALTSFAYNLGIGNLRASTLLRLHKEGDYAAAQKQFARWDKAAGKVMAGLTRRRATEAAVYGGSK